MLDRLEGWLDRWSETIIGCAAIFLLGIAVPFIGPAAPEFWTRLIAITLGWSIGLLCFRVGYLRRRDAARKIGRCPSCHHTVRSTWLIEDEPLFTRCHCEAFLQITLTVDGLYVCLYVAPMTVREAFRG